MPFDGPVFRGLLLLFPALVSLSCGLIGRKLAATVFSPQETECSGKLSHTEGHTAGAEQLALSLRLCSCRLLHDRRYCSPKPS